MSKYSKFDKEFFAFLVEFSTKVQFSDQIKSMTLSFSENKPNVFELKRINLSNNQNHRQAGHLTFLGENIDENFFVSGTDDIVPSCLYRSLMPMPRRNT